jgi:hypothetical protein
MVVMFDLDVFWVTNGVRFECDRDLWIFFWCCLHSDEILFV